MMIDTSGPGGGMMKKMNPDHQITNYMGVPSVDEYPTRVEKLGDKVVVPKTAVPSMGYFVICLDSDNNL